MDFLFCFSSQSENRLLLDCFPLSEYCHVSINVIDELLLSKSAPSEGRIHKFFFTLFQKETTKEIYDDEADH